MKSIITILIFIGAVLIGTNSNIKNKIAHFCLARVQRGLVSLQDLN